MSAPSPALSLTDSHIRFEGQKITLHNIPGRIPHVSTSLTKLSITVPIPTYFCKRQKNLKPPPNCYYVKKICPFLDKGTTLLLHLHNHKELRSNLGGLRLIITQLCNLQRIGLEFFFKVKIPADAGH